MTKISKKRQEVNIGITTVSVAVVFAFDSFFFINSI